MRSTEGRASWFQAFFAAFFPKTFLPKFITFQTKFVHVSRLTSWKLHSLGSWGEAHRYSEKNSSCSSRGFETKNFKLFGTLSFWIKQNQVTDLKVKWDGQSRVFTWWITTSKADTLVCLKFVLNVFFNSTNFRTCGYDLWNSEDSPMTWGQIASANSKLDVSHSSQMFSWNWTYSVCTAQEVFCILGWQMWCSHTSQSEYEVIRNHKVYMESHQE